MSTLADNLRAAGWRCMAAGKYDIGMHTWAHTPTFRGFEHFVGFYNGELDRVLPTALCRSSNSSTTQQIVRESVTLRVPASFATSEQNGFLSLWLVYVPIGSGAVVFQRRRTISPTKSASTSTCEMTRSHCAARPALTARTCTALPWWTSSLPTPRQPTRHRCSVICSLRQGHA